MVNHERVLHVLQRITVEPSVSPLRQEVRLQGCYTSSCGLLCPASLWDDRNLLFHHVSSVRTVLLTRDISSLTSHRPVRNAEQTSVTSWSISYSSALSQTTNFSLLISHFFTITIPYGVHYVESSFKGHSALNSDKIDNNQSTKMH